MLCPTINPSTATDDEKPLSSPTQQTSTHPFESAVALIDSWIAPNGVPGVGAAIWHRGKIVAERYAGSATQDRLVDGETLFALASVSKPVTAAAVMAAIDDGHFGLDDVVVDLLPEFNADTDLTAIPALEHLRPLITVRHLLAHTSGLPESAGTREEVYGGGRTLDELTDAMCGLPLQSAPNEVLRYSNVGYAVLARLTERHTGREFWDQVATRVLRRMDLSGIVARPSPVESGRIATVRDAANPDTPVESYNSPYWRDLAIPWGGYFGTPRALASFVAAFLPSQRGSSPLSPSSMAAMTTDQADGMPGGVESGKIDWPAASWGLGWEIKGIKERHWTGNVTSQETFCHFGQAGTLLWADPTRELALAVFANRAVTRAWTFFLSNWIRLSDAVATAAER